MEIDPNVVAVHSQPVSFEKKAIILLNPFISKTRSVIKQHNKLTSNDAQ